MNVVFVLYHDFTANSSQQVHQLANLLQGRGHQCLVLVPGNEGAVEHLAGAVRYRVATHAAAPTAAAIGEGGGPQVIHAWTPRENVRRTSLGLVRRFPRARLVVHLEDNEEIIVGTYLRLPPRVVRALPDSLLAALLPQRLSVPERSRQFLRAADGVTVVVDALAPAGIPTCRLWPFVDLDSFSPDRSDGGWRARLGIEPSEKVLCYPGNVHPANKEEVRELYLGVARAAALGVRVRLLRTGKDHCGFLRPSERRCRDHVVELGFLEAAQIPSLLAAADILVQPGAAGAFNDYRFPCKLPEFLASGKPTALPATNVGLLLKDREEALLRAGDREEIGRAIATLAGDDDLRARLGRGGRAFAERSFRGEAAAERLVRFYEGLAQKRGAA